MLLTLLLISSGAIGTLGNKILVTFPKGESRSEEVCCKDKFLRSCRNAAVDPDLLIKQEDISIIDIDLQFNNRVEPNGYVYKNIDGDEAVITYNKRTGNMFGSFKTVYYGSYAIEKCHNDYVWKEFDVKSFEKEIFQGTSLPEIAGKKKLVEQGVADTTTPVTYSVMLYYTPEFASVTSDIPGFMDQALAETNQGYVNSQIPLTITKHCIEEATISDIADTSTFISTFRAMKGSDAALRNTADAAYLLAKDFNSCGVGYLATYANGLTVSIAQKSCALGYYTFAHELGHNFGCHHDPAVADNTYFSYGHGHHIEQGSASTGYRTILAYSASGHQTRVNYYSDPLINLPLTQTATGVAGLSDNARGIRENRFSFASLGDESAVCSDGSTTQSTTQSTTPTPTTTTECEHGKYPKQLKVIKKIKKVKKWTQCRDLCNNDSDCEYFKWKDHKKWQKRQCFLMIVAWLDNSSWISGAKFCE